MRQVLILPQMSDTATGGVARHIRALHKHLPQVGWEVVRRAQPDTLIHCHALDRFDPLDVYTNHGIYPERHDMPDWQRKANEAILANLKLARRVVAVSRWTAAQWGARVGRWPVGVAHDRPGTRDVYVIPNGVDLDEWQDIPEGHWRARLQAGDAPIVLWGKTGISDVLDPTPAIELALRYRDVLVVAPLPRSALPSAPPNFRCLGPQPFRSMQLLLADCDVYLATVQENHSLQVLEAMALGKPVLGYAWGGTSETIISGYDGLLVPPGDLDRLAEGLRSLLDDKRMAEQLGQAARQTVAERYQWEQQVKRLAAVYEDALADRERERSAPCKVSVIIPCYNKAPYVRQAITSVLEQQGAPSFEVIIVDDGSTDDSAEVIQDAIGDDPRCRYVHQENAGVAAARNLGISLARGRYITCLDADDWIHPLFLSRLAAALDADPALGFAYSDMVVVNMARAGREIRLRGKEFDFAALRQGNYVPCCNMFRRVAWERAGGYKDINPSWEDYELWLNMAKLGWYGRRVPGHLFYYRKLPRQGRDYESHGQEWRLRAVVNSLHRDLYAPLVSVVIPCFGHSDFLADAIDSALAQTFLDLEVVVVDDGNPRQEAERIAAICRRYPNEKVRLLRHDRNYGLATARNSGVQAAFGQWIVPLDADDMILPAFVERCLRATGMDPHLFAYTDSIVWWPPGVEPNVRDQRLEPEPDEERGGLSVVLPAEDYDFATLLRKVSWACTILYHRQAWRDAGGYKAVLSEVGGWEDWDFAITLGENGVCGVRVPEALFVYRQHSPGQQMRYIAAQNKARLKETLRRLHAATYRGEWPMACCGRGRRGVAQTRAATVSNTRRVASANPNGKLMPIRYVGDQVGRVQWRGPSGRAYVFSQSQPVQQVLETDAAWFLNREDFVPVI